MPGKWAAEKSGVVGPASSPGLTSRSASASASASASPSPVPDKPSPVGRGAPRSPCAPVQALRLGEHASSRAPPLPKGSSLRALRLSPRLLGELVVPAVIVLALVLGSTVGGLVAMRMTGCHVENPDCWAIARSHAGLKKALAAGAWRRGAHAPHVRSDLGQATEGLERRKGRGGIPDAAHRSEGVDPSAQGHAGSDQGSADEQGIVLSEDVSDEKGGGWVRSQANGGGWGEDPEEDALAAAEAARSGRKVGRGSGQETQNGEDEVENQNEKELKGAAIDRETEQREGGGDKGQEQQDLEQEGADVLDRRQDASTDTPQVQEKAYGGSALPQLDDAELFERALEVRGRYYVRTKDGKRRSKRKLALMFLVRGPIPLAPFWSEFLAGHKRRYSIYIHTAKGYQYPEGHLPKAFQGRQIRSENVRWGYMSMVDAERRLLANALLDPQNARFALLSDSCIPIYNFSYTYDYLMKTPYSFVRGSNYQGPAGTDRWNRNFLPLVTKQQWRKGSQWIVVDREVAQAIVADTTYYPLFEKFCTYHHDCYPDEHYMQTMLYQTMEHKLANRSVTWVDWSHGAASPLAFSGGGVAPYVVAKVRATKSCTWNGIKTYCYVFARKFLPDSIGPLLKIAPHFKFK